MRHLAGVGRRSNGVSAGAGERTGGLLRRSLLLLLHGHVLVAVLGLVVIVVLEILVVGALRLSEESAVSEAEAEISRLCELDRRRRTL